MKLVVLNGSPKGATSVTVHYVRWLAQQFPEHEFQIVHVCQELPQLEQDAAAFDAVIQAVAQADAVVWAFPLYYLLVHAQYKRFIELVFQRRAEAAFRGRYAVALSTSIRFFDHTAHHYIHAVSDDLGMPFCGSYSAAMYDLLQAEERRRLRLFAEQCFAAVESRACLPRAFPPVAAASFAYEPGPGGRGVNRRGRRLLIVTDDGDEQTNLGRMIVRLRDSFTEPPEVVNLGQAKIVSGCTGCLQCSLDNVCVFREADDIYPLYQKLLAADALVLAGTVTDRYLSARWKMFFDRGFFHNHVPVFAGKQFGLLVAGPLTQNANLRQVLEGYVECQQASLVGAVTDECGDSPELDRQLDSFAERLAACTAAGYLQPPSFFGVAGGKLFRDELWANMRVVFKADHRYYKQHGLYNFPKRSLRVRLSDAFLTVMLRFPAFRRAFQRRMKDEMVKPLAKVLEQRH